MEALRAELDRLAEQVAAEQELLRRLEITRQTVLEVLADSDPDTGEDADAGVAAASLVAHEGSASVTPSATGMLVPVVPWRTR